MHVGSPILWCLCLSLVAHLAAAAWLANYTPPNASAARPGFSVHLTAATPVPRANGVAPAPVVRVAPEQAKARSARIQPTRAVARETARATEVAAAATVTPALIRPVGPSKHERAAPVSVRDPNRSLSSASRVVAVKVTTSRKALARQALQPQSVVPAPTRRTPAAQFRVEQVVSERRPDVRAESVAAVTSPQASPQVSPQAPPMVEHGDSDDTGTNASAVPAGGDAGRTAAPRAGSENPPPVYPWVARLHRQQGRVVLRVDVRADGSTDDLEVVRSSGYRSLDNAALAAVSKWYFQPATRGGHTVAATVDVPVVFRLEGRP